MSKEKIQKNKKKIFEGQVISHYQNTSVISVDRFVKHSKYGKFISVSKKYHAHDENQERKVGDKVKIKESKPISKTKRFIVIG